MNGEDQFERRLQSHPQRRIPTSWREEILNGARVAQARQAAALRGTPGTTDLVSWLKGWFWPAPRAWAGLAAVWLVVLGLELGSHDSSRIASANRAMPASPQLREMLREQRELFAELAGSRQTSEGTKPIPQPRSQRRDESAMV